MCWSLFWRTCHCYGLVCPYPGWLLAFLAFVSGCFFGSVGIQASVFQSTFCFALPLLAQLPMVYLDPTFPPEPFLSLRLLPCLLFSFNRPFLLPLFLSISFIFSAVLGIWLSPLDLCITLKVKIYIYVKVPRFFLLGAYLKEKEKERSQILLTLPAWVREGCCFVFCTTQWMHRHTVSCAHLENKRRKAF